MRLFNPLKVVEKADHLILKSPGYPNGYPSDLNCYWELFVEEKDIMIELEILAFHVEESNDCQFDALEISDGMVGLGMSLCGELGQEVPGNYQMRNNHVKLYFYSDEVHGYEGFEIKVILRERPKPTPIPAHVLFQCDFDFDICGFHHGQGATIEWIRMRDATPSDDTGPPHDLSKTGYYMYFEASDRNVGDLARLFTATIDYDGAADNSNLDLDPHCFQFYFDMYGEDMGSLRLYLVHEVGEKSSDKALLWEAGFEQRRRADSKDNPWKQVSLTFYPYGNFYLMFEAEAGDGYRSDMAIDEIRVSRGMCLDCTGAGLFNCEDDESTCILEEFSCDGYRDCPNGLDEENCLDDETRVSIEHTCENESLTNLPVCRPDNYKTSCVDGTLGNQLCDGKWDCLYGSDEAGCSTEIDENLCGSPDPEPRHNMGWATGRAKFQKVLDYKWAWTGTLYHNRKFQCSVHMVAENWYLSTLKCVKKGLVKTRRSSEWYTYGGCSIEEEINIERSVSPESFMIEHHNVYEEVVAYNVSRIILHPDSQENSEENQLVLINTENSGNNPIRRPICFKENSNEKFLFELDRPHLCQVVGHRTGQTGKQEKWQSLAPVKFKDDTLWVGYRMLLVQPFHDDPGTALFCQAWDQRWHLVGLMKEIPQKDASKSSKRQNWPSIRAGQNTFSDIQKLASWVQQECPGQFLCRSDNRCILLQSVCDGRIDCSDGSDENACSSGCGATSWLDQSEGRISVATDVKTCTWIYDAKPGFSNFVKFEKILTDSDLRIISYDSQEGKWIVYKDPITFISSKPNASLTIRIDLDIPQGEKSLLDIDFQYKRVGIDQNGKIDCGSEFSCSDGLTCVANELKCNGLSDCPAGDDEENCHDSTCGNSRYIKALEQEAVFYSQNYPSPWLGRGACKFTFFSDTGLVSLDFVEFTSGDHDLIRIYDGSGCSKKLVQSASGRETFSFLSSSNIVHIETNHSDQIHLRRFKVIFKTVPL